MHEATYEHFVRLDPTESPLFKLGLFFDRLVTKVQFRFLVVMTRLLFLGFYDDLRIFLEKIELAEGQAQSESEHKAVWDRKMKVAQETEKLAQLLQSMGRISYQGSDLVAYIVGQDRLEEIKIFVELARLEGRGEAILEQTKRDFLGTFGKRRLTRDQRTTFVRKHKELSQVLSGSSKFPS